MLFAVCSGFIAAVVAPFIHRFLRGASAWVIGLVPLGLFLYFLSLLPGALHGHPLHSVHQWIPSLNVALSFHADGLGLLFAILISGIGFLVTVYSGGYLHGHPQLDRWYCYLMAFMASMLGVVLSDNVIALFVFWELTSLTSYLLIGFNHEEEDSRAAALQALLVTGAGGLAMMAGLILMSMAGGSMEISELAARGGLIRSDGRYGAILALILLGAFTKSAQFPFHYWLPNAMAAPTPASAYLHSSTMVKAGIYLLARLSPVLAGTASWQFWVTGIGAVTMMLGAWLALQQDLLKRLLAYSTVSALGAIVMLLGLGGESAALAAMAFLLAHALYKAALFLVAGAVDHETGERNVQRLGGLAKAMPFTAAAAGAAALSMGGIPLLFGFVAKEMLYESTLHAHGLSGGLLTAVAVLSSMFFVAVGCCVAYKPFYGSRIETPKHPHEAPPAMWLGPVLLGVFSLSFGLLPGWPASLISAAGASILGSHELHAHLALWHGFTPALGLSVLTLLGGLAAYRWRPAIRRTALPLQEAGAKAGPEQWYAWSLKGLVFSAKWQTKILQNGYMRNYVLTLMLAALAFAGGAFFLAMAGHSPGEFMAWLMRAGFATTPHFHEVGLAIIVTVAIAVTVHARERLMAVAALGVVGYGMSLFWVLFGAPDLAMTQIAVETLTVILFVLAFYHLPTYRDYSSTPVRVRDFVISAVIGGSVALLVLMASSVDSGAPLKDFYGQYSYDAAHGRNIVNVILVDFRGFDTMGEITVLALAAVGAYALLKLRLHGKAGK